MKSLRNGTKKKKKKKTKKITNAVKAQLSRNVKEQSEGVFVCISRGEGG